MVGKMTTLKDIRDKLREGIRQPAAKRPPSIKGDIKTSDELGINGRHYKSGSCFTTPDGGRWEKMDGDRWACLGVGPLDPLGHEGDHPPDDHYVADDESVADKADPSPSRRLKKAVWSSEELYIGRDADAARPGSRRASSDGTSWEYLGERSWMEIQRVGREEDDWDFVIDPMKTDQLPLGAVLDGDKLKRDGLAKGAGHAIGDNFMDELGRIWSCIKAAPAGGDWRLVRLTPKKYKGSADPSKAITTSEEAAEAFGEAEMAAIKRERADRLKHLFGETAAEDIRDSERRARDLRMADRVALRAEVPGDERLRDLFKGIT